MKFMNIDEPNSIIKYYKDGCNYTVFYDDGDEINYYCSAEGHDKKIEEEMLEQIKKKYNLKKIKVLGLRNNLHLLTLAFSSMCCLMLKNQVSPNFSLFTSAIFGASLYGYLNSSRDLKEAKKYQMFLELFPNLQEVNKSDSLKEIEFDNLYQVPLGVNTIGEYSYGDVKTLYKKYNDA